MSQPAVNITELDGALGVLPASAGRLLACVGTSTKGPLNTPATFARVRDVVETFGSGPLVEAAAVFIKTHGRPCVIVRTGQSVAGSFPADDAVSFSGSGTSTVTVDDVNTAPHDDLEFYFLVTSGGTVGTTGIEFQYSIDGGRTMSAIQSLGISNSFVFPESGGVEVEFGAGTLSKNDSFSFVGKAPKWNNTELAEGIAALFATQINWEICEVVGEVESTSLDVIDSLFNSALQNGKAKSWIGNVRVPDLGESSSAYQSSLTSAFTTKATKMGALCAGAADIVSGVSGRIYRRPISFAVAALEQSVSEEINIADVDVGNLVGVSIRDRFGNPKEHDESLNPGLDDARFVALRTWEGFAGVYVNRMRIFSSAGSDFDLHTKRRVINLAHTTLRAYFTRRLNKPIRVDASTGFILEQEALEMEHGGRTQLASVLLFAKPKASAVDVIISRTDNILSTKTLTVTARVTPLGYAEFIEIDLGFVNPALAVRG